VQYVDKATLNSAFVLGIARDAKLTTDDFNTLGSAFYIGYLVFQYPQNLALQRFPVGKWMTFNLFLWCVPSSASLSGADSACARVQVAVPRPPLRVHELWRAV
jgi:hypothetical protein